MLVLQIVLTSLDSDRINLYGWGEAEAGSTRVRAYLSTRFDGSAKWEPAFLAEYEVTGSIETDDLEEAFDAGNGHGQAKVVRSPLGRGMRSVSVGDILVDADGGLWMTEAQGFKLLPGAA
jgi:hypothetical protein